MVGTRDILQAPYEAPYACPNGTHYCFDQAVQAQWTNLTKPPSSLIVGRAAVAARGYTRDHRVSVEDAYLDTLGRTLVLLSVSDASTRGTYENHLIVIGATGSITDVAYVGVPYPTLSRIVEDPSGRFWIYSVGPALIDEHRCDLFIAGVDPANANGAALGPATVIPLGRRFDCSTETRNYDVSVRSGTAPASYIDGVVATNGGADWAYYRIALPQTQGPRSRRVSALNQDRTGRLTARFGFDRLGSREKARPDVSRVNADTAPASECRGPLWTPNHASDNRDRAVLLIASRALSTG
jgi:hypothetical protein